MRKRVMTATSAATPEVFDWLDVRDAALVELTSEDQSRPIESALLPGGQQGWRASGSGRQIIRLVFDEPKHLRRIRLDFEETEVARTQEFVLRCSADAGASYREIVRQQWNFSPPETIRETEEYVVDLPGATVLELDIIPDTSGGEARASLLSLRFC